MPQDGYDTAPLALNTWNHIRTLPEMLLTFFIVLSSIVSSERYLVFL